jgi:hypothetical protein
VVAPIAWQLNMPWVSPDARGAEYRAEHNVGLYKAKPVLPLIAQSTPPTASESHRADSKCAYWHWTLSGACRTIHTTFPTGALRRLHIWEEIRPTSSRSAGAPLYQSPLFVLLVVLARSAAFDVRRPYRHRTG